jgi:phage/plasmid primase-like uncharacterized protein
MDSGNLKPVALALMSKIRREHLGAEIIFCADNDTTKEKNVGYLKAKEAPKAIDGTPAAYLSLKNITWVQIGMTWRCNTA